MTPKPHSREHLYPREVIDRLFKAAETLDDRFMLTCLVFGGLRVSEYCHLQASWWAGEGFKLPKRQACTCFECRDDQTKRIARAAKDGKVLLAADLESYWQPKTRAGVRIVPMPPFYRPLISNYLKQHPDGPGISRRHVLRRLKLLAHTAGLDDVNVFPHAFRATLASMMADQGIDGWVMKEIFGWASITSADSYIHTSQKRMESELRTKGVW